MRVGDIYEAYDEDADTLALTASIAKTVRAEHRMAGFPHMQLGHFLTVLVGAGYRVATAEQVSDQPVGKQPLPGKPAVLRWPSTDEKER
jgi:DNA mismatch repair ATPase MutS